MAAADDNDIQMSPNNDAKEQKSQIITDTNSSELNEQNDKEEKKQSDNLISNNQFNPLLLVQSAMSEFLNEMTVADIKSSTLYDDHLERQQRLMDQFVCDSLRLMHEFNTKIDPIHTVLSKLKEPLQDVLLNQFIAIPCDSLDEITKKTRRTAYTKTWGISPLTYKYNQKNAISNNPHLQYISLGPEIESLKSTINMNNNNKKESNDDDNDSVMNDNEQNNKNNNNNLKEEPTVIDTNDLYTQAILGYLSNTNNITSSQTDLVLKFFNTARAEQQRIENRKVEKIKAMQQKQQQIEQRKGGAQMLINVLPWMTLDQAAIVMEMKQDNIEQATNYCMGSDPADLFIAINEWKTKHPQQPQSTSTSTTTMNIDSDINNNNNFIIDNAIFGRSSMDKRVMNRTQSSGNTKCVIFRCKSISDDGQITLVGVLDRNNIPLDPSAAKLLHLSVSDLLQYDGVNIISSELVNSEITNNILQITFQVIKEAPPQIDVQSILQNIQIPDHIMESNDFALMQQYAQQYIAEQSQNNNTNSWNRRNKDKTEFIPIQFKPRCRDLEYKLDFEDKDIASSACLKGVSHRMDGPVLYRGIYDDGQQLSVIGVGLNQPIEIYSDILNDTTHNIICIIFDNEIRQDLVIDVKNISFTEQTLENIIADSESDFIKKDMAGNKISYRIIVKDKKIIGVLTRFANQIKEMPFIEHILPSEGDLISIPNRNMLGIIKCIPTGLIVTNDPNTNIKKKICKYKKNVNSKILRKHWAEVAGYIDIDIVREGISGVWRLIDDPLCQSFAVTDIIAANDNDINQFIQYKSQNQGKQMDNIKLLIQNIENDLNFIKNNKLHPDNSNKLKELTKNVKNIQELCSNLKNTKKLNDEETVFLKSVNENINKYNREIRVLGFEQRMSSTKNTNKQ